MKKTLIVVAHPNMNNSVVNKRRKKEIENLSNTVVHDIYEKYPDGNINIEKELELLAETGTLILQFPIYWFNCPPLLKKWIDDVFMAAHYGNNKILEGKKIGLAVTAGGMPQRYDGSQGLTIREVLTPFVLSINHVNGVELPIYTLFGIIPNEISDEKIEEDAKGYIKYVESNF